MDLHYLKYITTIAEEENMSRAAALLHISQPTLSVYVKNLEEELGLPLFIRSYNRMTLTPAGEAYVAACRQILRIRDELYLTLDSMKTPQLKIVTTTSNIPALLEALTHFHREYPGIMLVPTVLPAPQIDETLESRINDFAISTGSLDPQQKKPVRLTFTSIQECELMLVLSARNPVFEKLDPEKPLTQEELELIKQLPFISQAFGTSKAKYDMGVLTELGITPPRQITLNDTKFILQSILRDNAYALMPYSRFTNPDLRMFHLPGNHVSSRVLKYLSDRRLTAADKRFIELVKQEYELRPYFYQV